MQHGHARDWGKKSSEGVIVSGVNVGREHGVRAKDLVQGLVKVKSGVWVHNLPYSAIVVSVSRNRRVAEVSQ